MFYGYNHYHSNVLDGEHFVEFEIILSFNDGCYIFYLLSDRFGCDL